MRLIQSESRREATKIRLAKPKTLSSVLSEFKEVSSRFSDRNAIVHDLEPIYLEASIDDGILNGIVKTYQWDYVPDTLTSNHREEIY